MLNSTCCFTCGYFHGCHVNALGFVRGYCSFASDQSDSGRCKLIIAPFHFTCDNYGSFIDSYSDDLLEYDPSDPFGSIDPEFFDSSDPDW